MRQGTETTIRKKIRCSEMESMFALEHAGFFVKRYRGVDASDDVYSPEKTCLYEIVIAHNEGESAGHLFHNAL